MSVRDHIESSKLLFAAGHLEGALHSVLAAVAGTSRKRYPNTSQSVRKPNQKMSSEEAFLTFLDDERGSWLDGRNVTLEFDGRTLSIEQILWAFARSPISHEAQLDDRISVAYGDFLLARCGTGDLTLSSEVICRLAYVVEGAAENKEDFPDGVYDGLPEPVDLQSTTVIKFQWGNDKFELLCHACSLVTQKWEETGEVVEWLHLKGVQVMRGNVLGNTSRKYLVPAKFFTAIDAGPTFNLVRRRSVPSVGVFPPNRPEAPGRLALPIIEQRISELQIPLKTTTAQLQRPDY